MVRAVVIVLLVARVANAAWGQPAGVQAESLFRQAKSLVADGRIDEACAAFEQSQRLEPAITTLLNLADCEQRRERFATALELFLEVDRQTRDRRDQASRMYNQVAQERSKGLAARVSLLTIAVPNRTTQAGLQVRRDDTVVEPAQWDRAIPVDGGRYRITALFHGTPGWSVEVVIRPEGDDRVISVPRLAPMPAAASTTPPAGGRRSSSDRSGAIHGGKRVAIGLTLGGVVLFGTAYATSRWGDAFYDEAAAETLSQARRDDLYDAANRRRYVAQGLAGGGLVLCGAALWLYLRGRASDGPSSTVATRVVVGSRRLAFQGVF